MSFGNTQATFPSPLPNFSQFYSPQLAQQQQVSINTNTMPSNVVYATPATTNSALNLTSVTNASTFCLPTLTVPPPVATSTGTFGTGDQIQYQQVKFKIFFFYFIIIHQFSNILQKMCKNTIML